MSIFFFFITVTNFYSRARHFLAVCKSLIVANNSFCEPIFAIKSCNNKTGLDKDWSRNSVVANQCISGKSRNNVAVNNSWFTVTTK